MSIDINNLYIAKHDPKLFKRFVSTSTKGVFEEVEVVLTFYISPTGKAIWGELKAYDGCKIIAKCAVKKQVTDYLDKAIRETARNLLEIVGFSDVSYRTLSQIDYRGAGALVREVLQQITEINPVSTSLETTYNWRLL